MHFLYSIPLFTQTVQNIMSLNEELKRKTESLRDLVQNILFIYFKNIFTHEFQRVGTVLKTFQKLNGIS